MIFIFNLTIILNLNKIYMQILVVINKNQKFLNC